MIVIKVLKVYISQICFLLIFAMLNFTTNLILRLCETYRYRSFFPRGRNAASSALSVMRLRAIPRSRLGWRIDSCLLSGDRFASRNIFHGFLSIPRPSIRRLFAVAHAAEKCEQRNRRTRAGFETVSAR